MSKSIEKEKRIEKVEEKKEDSPKKIDKRYFKLWIGMLSISVVFILFIFIALFCLRSRKDVYIELGTDEILLSDFFYNGRTNQFDGFVTDIKTIDLSKVGDYVVEIKDLGITKKVNVHIVDTTAPEVVFKDVYAYTNYTFSVDDFIESKSDLSEITVNALNIPEITGFGDYPVQIEVKDAYGNVTTEERTLHIGVIKTSFTLELGNKLSKEDLVYDIKDIDSIKDEDIARINSGGIGEYEIEAVVNGQTFVSKILVRDSLPPNLVLKEVTIFDDVEGVAKEDFIASVSDASEFTTTLKTEITYKTVGEQEIVLEASDVHGNKIEQKTLLKIVHDTEAPLFYGLSDVTVAKYSSFDYNRGVTAKDNKDGVVSFTVDSSRVSLNQAGTYYATYIATDKAGNQKKASRKITVKHDATDTANKVKQFASKAGNSVPEINNYVKTNIHYSDSWGDDDPVWYGLTNYRGNCYVHAKVMEAVLKEKGYETLLIWTTDKTHYWNMVKVDGKWYHTDATPGSKQEGIILANDEKRYEMLQYQSHPRDWDRSLWPEANS